MRAWAAARPGCLIVERGRQCRCTLIEQRHLVAQHLRVRRARLSGKADEPLHVVALVQVDDALDCQHDPRASTAVL